MSAVWTVLTFALILSDITGWEVVGTALLTFALLLELVTLATKDPHDAWSDWVTKQVRGEWATIPAVIGFAVWLPWQILERYAPGHEIVSGRDWGLLALVIGAMMTLALHWIVGEKYDG